ncbi:Hypothetical protein NTJ_05418 [Nesidiocoris tenuis]|uniref:Uncharacterized protein n=1 Tax=Nesidiocoris tenuis TaxID=355587 RepID=A0ABN7AMZ0_9HEMI|nr:Hypothetical protein NTJ_05418 [Nesidiocoris tenuis]
MVFNPGMAKDHRMETVHQKQPCTAEDKRDGRCPFHMERPLRGCGGFCMDEDTAIWDSGQLLGMIYDWKSRRQQATITLGTRPDLLTMENMKHNI